MPANPSVVFEAQMRNRALAEEESVRRTWERSFAPEIATIQFHYGRGMSRMQLERIYGALKVGLALPKCESGQS